MRVIGRGAASTVFREGDVVIKQYHEDYDGDPRREYEIGRRLNGVPGFAETVSMPDVRTVVTRFVRGASLDDEVASLTPEQAASTALRVRDIVLSVGEGFCHGDLCLGNIIVEGEGVTLIDFAQSSFGNKKIEGDMLVLVDHMHIGVVHNDASEGWAFFGLEALMRGDAKMLERFFEGEEL